MSEVLFFTTDNCKLCRPIKGKIHDNEFPRANITIINEDVEKMYEYGVKSVPSIFVVEKNQLVVGQEKVLKYMEEHFV